MDKKKIFPILLILFLTTPLALEVIFNCSSVAQENNLNLICDKIHIVRHSYYNTKFMDATTFKSYNGNATVVIVGARSSAVYCYSYNAYQDITYEFIRWNRAEEIKLAPEAIDTLGDRGFAIVAGGYIRNNNTDVFIQSFDPDLFPEWRVTWGSEKVNETVIDIASNVENVFILGTANYENRTEAFILKYEIAPQLPVETIVLSKVFNFTISEYSILKAMDVDNAGNVYIVGIYDIHGSSFVIKVDSKTGAIVFNRTLYKFNEDILMNDIAVYDGISLVVGSERTDGEDANVSIWALDETGNTITHLEWEYGNNTEEVATSVTFDNYGIAYITGYVIDPNEAETSNIELTRDVIFISYDTNSWQVIKSDVVDKLSDRLEITDDVATAISVDSGNGIVFITGTSRDLMPSAASIYFGFIIVYATDNNKNNIGDYRESVPTESEPLQFHFNLVDILCILVSIVSISIAVFVLIKKKR